MQTVWQTVWQTLGRTIRWLMTPGLMLILPFTTRTRVLLTCGDQILVVRGWLSDGRWQLPGGGLHRGEAPEIGAQRELREETDLILPDGKFTDPQLCRFHERGKNFKYYLFMIEINHTVPPRRGWPEIIACEWVGYRTLSAHNASADVMQAVEAWKR